MKEYQFTKRKQPDLWVDNLGFIENAKYEIYDGDNHIGNFISGKKYSFFAFEDVSCRIDNPSMSIYPTMQIIDLTNDVIVGYRLKTNSYNILIQYKPFDFYRVDNMSGCNIFKLETWKRFWRRRFAFETDGVEIIYDIGSIRGAGLFCECDGFISIPDKLQLFQAFCGLYFLDEHFQTSNTD